MSLPIISAQQRMAERKGVKPGIAAAATLTCIQENTGITTEVLRRALPSANEPICALNATQLGKLLNRSAKATNQLLAAGGFQLRNERDEWELTEAGEAWAEAMPYPRGRASGLRFETRCAPPRAHPLRHRSTRRSPTLTWRASPRRRHRVPWWKPGALLDIGAPAGSGRYRPVSCQGCPVCLRTCLSPAMWLMVMA